jgi:hypothetical protein
MPTLTRIHSALESEVSKMPRTISLQEEKSATRKVWVDVTLEDNGAVTVSTCVMFGGGDTGIPFSESEWVCRLNAEHVPALRNALGGAADVLAALHERYAGDDALSIREFMQRLGVPVTLWTRDE